MKNLSLFTPNEMGEKKGVKNKRGRKGAPKAHPGVPVNILETSFENDLFWAYRPPAISKLIYTNPETFDFEFVSALI